MISILVVDDDLLKISKIIDCILENKEKQLEVKQASNVQEALEILRLNQFHLLITDLLMPIRPGELPDKNGGDVLVREIYRGKNKANVPLYIIGLTQFEEVKNNFSEVWKVLKYDSTNISWQKKLKDLVFHIERIDSKILKVKKETLFVEGVTDKLIISKALNLFFNGFTNSITIETQKTDAGSSWVIRQLVIWGKLLFRKDKENYLQAIGLLDNDKAGLEAMDDLKVQVPNGSAERSTFSILSLDRKYAKHLIPIFQGGVMLPITLEEMFPPFCWQYALTIGWLIQRPLTEEILQDPQKWDKTNQSLTEYINSLNLKDDEIIYIKYKINPDFKVNFTNYILNLDSQSQVKALSPFIPLLEDCFKKLKIN